MKIEINYDLLDKIREAKTGFSLNRTIKPFISISLLQVILMRTISAISPLHNQEILFDILSFSIPNTICVVALNLFSKEPFKDISINKLKKLSSDLKDIYVNTNYDLLLNSYKYKTEYRVKFNESFIPYLKQEKYIMIPTHNNGEEKEVSVVQEHIIGSKKYSLSYGSPKKVLKPTFNPI